MNSEFKVLEKDERSYLVAEPFEKLGVINGFSRRLGGVSSGKISGLNFGFRVGDDSDAVLENYRLLAEDLGFDIRRGVCARQMHTDNIRIVTENDCGKGIFQQESDIRDTDGLITNQRGIALIIFSADCVPLLFYDPIKQVVAASHAGWRGTVLRIAGKTVRILMDEYGADPRLMKAGIAPSIGPEAFEVGEEVVDAFREAGFEMSCILKRDADTGKAHIDLWEANRLQLLGHGVKAENIEVAGICTYQNYLDFFSARRLGIRSGRILSGIMLHR